MVKPQVTSEKSQKKSSSVTTILDTIQDLSEAERKELYARLVLPSFFGGAGVNHVDINSVSHQIQVNVSFLDKSDIPSLLEAVASFYADLAERQKKEGEDEANQN